MGAAEEAGASEETGASEEAGAALVAGAAEDGAAEEAPGTTMGTPAAAQVFSVAAMAAAWSSAEQALEKLVEVGSHLNLKTYPFHTRNDGCEELVGTLAVAGEVGERSATVSAQRGEEAAQSASWNVLELCGGDRGQGNECGDGEGLHVDC